MADSFSRKTSKLKIMETVPQTASGGKGEKPKVIGRTLPKELGKKAVVTSEYDLPHTSLVLCIIKICIMFIF